MLKNVNEYFMPVLVLILLSVLFACKNDEQNNQSSPRQSKEVIEDNAPIRAESEIANGTVKVQYFYSDFHRCASCRKIEAYTKKAVNENFSDEIKSGKLEFSLVNLDKDENKPAVDKYKLFTKSVIVSEFSGGREIKWQNLDKVWMLLNNEESFKAYIVKEIKAYL